MEKNFLQDLAVGLWFAYEYSLPDTPVRVARTALFILEREGWIICRATDEE